MDAFPQDHDRTGRLSIIEEGPEPRVRMAYLAVVGSHSVNGVAKLHSELLRTDLLRDFYDLYPERFNNKTNGVTPRRWLLACNPRLASLVTELIGPRWVTQLERLKELEPHIKDRGFLERLRAVKRANKEALATLVEHELGFRIDPTSLYDVQIKRLHEYKRQLLNALHIIALYLRIKRGEEVAPRTFIFGAKAAPGYRQAKLIIKLIHSIAEVVNDARGSTLKVVFLPNYRVSLAERIIPAADLSEQISTAGMEASGTGNMKLSMNGALTIGTLDGANIEIRDAVGAENFFLFGLTAKQVAERKRQGLPGRVAYEADEELKQAIDLLASGFFSPEEKDMFKPLVDELLGRDEYLCTVDFQSYSACQRQVSDAYRDAVAWSRTSALNIARVGEFSSDRTVREYAKDIWKVEAVKVDLEPYDPAGPPPVHGHATHADTT
jgi:starch phosphorylase